MNKVSELSDDLEAVSVVLGELKRELRTHRRFISANYPLPRSVILFSPDQFSTLSRSSDLLHSDH